MSPSSSMATINIYFSLAHKIRVSALSVLPYGLHIFCQLAAFSFRFSLPHNPSYNIPLILLRIPNFLNKLADPFIILASDSSFLCISFVILFRFFMYCIFIWVVFISLQANIYHWHEFFLLGLITSRVAQTLIWFRLIYFFPSRSSCHLKLGR